MVDVSVYDNLKDLYDLISEGSVDAESLPEDLKDDLIKYILDNVVCGTGSCDDGDSDTADLLEQLGFGNEQDLDFIRNYGMTYDSALDNLPASFSMPSNPYGISLCDYNTEDIVEYFDGCSSYVRADLNILLSYIDCCPEEEDDLATLIYIRYPELRDCFDSHYNDDIMSELRDIASSNDAYEDYNFGYDGTIDYSVDCESLSDFEEQGTLGLLCVEDYIFSEDIENLEEQGAQIVIDTVSEKMDYCCENFIDDTVKFLNSFYSLYGDVEPYDSISSECLTSLITNGLHIKVAKIFNVEQR